MSKPLIAAVAVASALCVAGVISTAYWILDPGAPDALLYAAPLAGVASVVICGLAALFTAWSERRR
jgi:hypothetical protein